MHIPAGCHALPGSIDSCMDRIEYPFIIVAIKIGVDFDIEAEI
jgi:hypothetical protein